MNVVGVDLLLMHEIPKNILVEKDKKNSKNIPHRDFALEILCPLSQENLKTNECHGCRYCQTHEYPCSSGRFFTVLICNFRNKRREE
ncbi:MAG: hypothetical protein GF308_15610 [Candidatus Heimdallarchaeota archaeon]|nr:hypothetical protein [Candidatus Heimdallarchaeota archaeon]